MKLLEVSDSGVPLKFIELYWTNYIWLTTLTNYVQLIAFWSYSIHFLIISNKHGCICSNLSWVEQGFFNWLSLVSVQSSLSSQSVFIYLFRSLFILFYFDSIISPPFLTISISMFTKNCYLQQFYSSINSFWFLR